MIIFIPKVAIYIHIPLEFFIGCAHPCSMETFVPYWSHDYNELIYEQVLKHVEFIICVTMVPLIWLANFILLYGLTMYFIVFLFTVILEGVWGYCEPIGKSWWHSADIEVWRVSFPSHLCSMWYVHHSINLWALWSHPGTLHTIL